MVDQQNNQQNNVNDNIQNNSIPNQETNENVTENQQSQSALASQSDNTVQLNSQSQQTTNADEVPDVSSLSFDPARPIVPPATVEPNQENIPIAPPLQNATQVSSPPQSAEDMLSQQQNSTQAVADLNSSNTNIVNQQNNASQTIDYVPEPNSNSQTVITEGSGIANDIQDINQIPQAVTEVTQENVVDTIEIVQPDLSTPMSPTNIDSQQNEQPNINTGQTLDKIIEQSSQKQPLTDNVQQVENRVSTATVAQESTSDNNAINQQQGVSQQYSTEFSETQSNTYQTSQSSEPTSQVTSATAPILESIDNLQTNNTGVQPDQNNLSIDAQLDQTLQTIGNSAQPIPSLASSDMDSTNQPTDTFSIDDEPSSDNDQVTNNQHLNSNGSKRSIGLLFLAIIFFAIGIFLMLLGLSLSGTIDVPFIGDLAETLR